MFLIIPWKVDVPQDRWPVMNWLVILALVSVFAVQVADLMEDANGPGTATNSQTEIPGITGALRLDGWNIKGLLGYMWLHGGLLHLLGNILFLWIFGNAVCAKLGNLRYLVLYVLVGAAAGIAHLLFSSQAAIGASGAINGVVGMYLVLFYENEITCLFVAWFILPYVRWFSVGSIWMILFWLLYDIVGALAGGSGVAYFAHLGGFATGFGIACLMCAKGWISMERYEKSLLQMWQQRKARAKEAALNAQYVRSGGVTAESPPPQPREATPSPKPGPQNARNDPLFGAFIHAVCSCGKQLMVSQQYAGKIIRCSECKQIVTVPLHNDSMSALAERPETIRNTSAARRHGHIRFACPCGKKIKVPARYAGRSGRCPRCGATLKIPRTTVAGEFSMPSECDGQEPPS